MKSRKLFGIFEVAIIIIVTALISGMTSGIIISNNSRNYSYADLTDNEPIKEFLEAYASIVTSYYEEVDEKQLINNAINGMLSYLGDDYTTYMSESAKNDLNNKLAGEYEGVGIQIVTEKDKGNVITEVFENSPAKEAGLLVGDIIIKINEENVEEKTTSQIVELIKKDKNKPVKITVLRDAKEYEFSVQMKKITLSSVTYEVITENNKKIGYLYIESFSANTATQVESALKKMESEGIESLIVDVRNNTGGYLSTAKEISNLFLEKGKIIYSLEEKAKLDTVKDTTDEKRSYPIAVLINNTTASAAEILAAALKESYGAILIGETTFGKGKVQQTMDLNTGGMYKYTFARWLTPKGTCIDGSGIRPDEGYEIKPDYSLQPKSEDESVFEKEYEEFSKHLVEIAKTQYLKAISILSE